MVKHLRKAVQAGWGILTNAYVKGFVKGGPLLYNGPLKHFCVPGMNCYSCPGALGACPIGALQNALAARNRKFPFYVAGYLAAVGMFAGRFICGWLCLFGLVQELLYKIPVPKLKIPEKVDKPLRYLKYLVLAVLVVGLPLFYRNKFGIGDPFFCKYLCPAGTLEAGIPQLLLNEQIRASLGWLFNWKMLVLVICIVSSMVIYRPFCKYLCPLGAFYALFQRVSIVRMKVDSGVCTHCGACKKYCPMNVDPSRTPNSAECIRCGECVRNCPVKALSMAAGANKRKMEKGEPLRL